MILITGPSGCGKDHIGARLIAEGKTVASLDAIGNMLTGEDGSLKWVIPADCVLRVIASRKYEYALGISCNIVEWIHLFDELIVPKIDLATAKLVCAAKQKAQAEEMKAKGKPNNKTTWWKEPQSLDEYYGGNGFWLKPNPYNFKGKVTLLENSHAENEGYAWHEWTSATDETKKRREELRTIARFVKDAPYAQTAPWLIQQMEATQPWTPFKSVNK
jgi:hypothetical protein